MASYPYRLDTNYAKMDRIVHKELEAFKTRVLDTKVNGMTVREWYKVFSSEDNHLIKRSLQDHLDIKEVDAEQLRK